MASTGAMILIDGTAMPDPVSLSVDIADVYANEEQNADGNLVKDLIGSKRKVSVEFSYMSGSQMQALLLAVNKPFFMVTYPDPLLGTHTAEFTVGNRTGQLYTYQADKKLWAGTKFDFTER